MLGDHLFIMSTVRGRGGAGGEGGGRKILDKLAGGSGCFLERGVFF